MHEIPDHKHHCPLIVKIQDDRYFSNFILWSMIRWRWRGDAYGCPYCQNKGIQAKSIYIRHLHDKYKNILNDDRSVFFSSIFLMAHAIINESRWRILGESFFFCLCCCFCHFFSVSIDKIHFFSCAAANVFRKANNVCGIS